MVGTLFLMIFFSSKFMDKLELYMFATEQHVLDPYIVFLVIKVYLNGG